MTRHFLRMRSGSPFSALLFLMAFAACGSDSSGGEGGAAADSIPADSAQSASEPPHAVGPATDLPPNELGEIMVLEYHRLGEPESEFYRSVANFRSDLQRLYEGGYRPITVRQMLEGDINLPQGTSPVVFTIDDASTGQFYYLPDGSIDPNSMVGIWEAFARENPGWDGGATWCVLPAAEHPSNFFSEKPDREIPREQREAAIKKKVDHLLAGGHEICNHTLYHARLDSASGDAQAQEWIGRGEDSIQVYLPADYDIVTLALPLGMWPQNRELAVRGSYNGSAYENEGVLEVAGGPSVSPFDREFDPHSIDRMPVSPNVLERQLATYDSTPARRYVSDGDANVISVPAGGEGRVATNRSTGKQVRPVAASAAAPAPAAQPAAATPPAQ